MVQRVNFIKMQRSIELGGVRLEYTLRTSKRARHVRLSIYPGGRVVITAPRLLWPRTIEKFLLSKSAWVIEKINYFKKISPSLPIKNSRKDFLLYKKQALQLAHERLEYFNKTYGFIYQKISIRNQKTRWGSCSKKGNISFNYKIALLPSPLTDYIIVHELCHLREFNHSKNFWNLVARTIPDYVERRREVKKNSLTV